MARYQDDEFDALDLDYEMLDVCRSAVTAGLIEDADGDVVDLEYFDFNIHTLSTKAREAFLQSIWDTI